MIVSKLLETPIPIALGLFAQAQSSMTEQSSMPPGGMGAPEYMIGVFAGIYLVAYVLKITGWMPHRDGKNAHSSDFTEADRLVVTTLGTEVKKMTDLLAFRDDDGFERFLKMNSRIAEHSDSLTSIANTQAAQTAILKTLSDQLGVVASALNRSA